MEQNYNLILFSLMANLFLIIWVIVLIASKNNLEHTLNFVFSVKKHRNFALTTTALAFYQRAYYLARKKSLEYETAFVKLFLNRVNYPSVTGAKDLRKRYLEEKVFSKDWDSVELPYLDLRQITKNEEAFKNHTKTLQSYL